MLTRLLELLKAKGKIKTGNTKSKSKQSSDNNEQDGIRARVDALKEKSYIMHGFVTRRQ